MVFVTISESDNEKEDKNTSLQTTLSYNLRVLRIQPLRNALSIQFIAGFRDHRRE